MDCRLSGNDDRLSGVSNQQERDLFTFSHGPLPRKSPNTCRIFYNNVNGFEINAAVGAAAKKKRKQAVEGQTVVGEQYTKVETIFQQLKTWEVSISALVEHCVEWKDAVPRLVLQDIGKQYYPKGMWNVSSSKVSVGSYLKPGGTLIHSAEEMAIRTVDKGSDPWGQGRWSFQRYQAKKGHTLLVVSAYRVGKRSTVPGSTTAWHQQKVLLTQQKRQEAPEEAFLIDLGEWLRLQKNQCDNMEIMLFLDANERWTEGSRIRMFADEMQLQNLGVAGSYNFPPSHPSITNPDRSTTIDYCLCTNTVVGCVQYASMAPYDLLSLGDHRGMIVDLNLSKLIGDSGHSPVDTQGRNLLTSNVAATKKYLELVEDGFNKQNVFARMERLSFQWKTKEKNKCAIMQTFEKLDREIYSICTKAEKRCKAVNKGKCAWSPELKKGINVLSYWRARLRYQEENQVVEKLGLETGINFTPCTDEEITEQIRNSRKKLDEIQRDSEKIRREYLEQRAQQYARDNNLSKSTAIQELISHESVRNTFQILRAKIKPNNSGPLRRIWVARDSHGNFTKDHHLRQVFETKEDVHQQLLKRNRKHLRQAKHTPFATGRLAKGLKWDGTGVVGGDILTGRILQHDEVSRTAKAYFDCLRTRHLKVGHKTVVPTLSLVDYRQFWKRKREDTVTSPFGLHVGHYKASTQNLPILNVHRQALLIPFQTGLVPSRWRRTVQTMLEKDPGQPWIHRLRIIELFDAQVNAGFQLFIGRRMIWEAVVAERLHPASYGSTPGKMAGSAVLQKILSIDQLRIERRGGGIFDCDATGCYDRIIPPFASINLQAMGLGHTIATLLARLMFTAKRYVKTHHGVSTNGIRTKKGAPLYGIGQGNGGGPAIWLAHLTIMFSALGSLCTGLVIAGIEGLRILRLIGTGYVDDVTLTISISNKKPQTTLRIRKKIQKVAQTWEKLLFITGGKLELTKCFWVPVQWSWKKGVPILKKVSPRSGKLYLTESESGEIVEIPLFKHSGAPKRLGIRYSTNGLWGAEYKYWKTYTTEYISAVRKAKLDRLGGFHSYSTLWCAKFRYVSSSVGFNATKLEAITKLVMGPSLAVAGYSSKMPRAVVFGPMKFGGLGWETPVSILLQSQLSMVIGSIRLNDMVGQMLMLQLEWLQLHSGMKTPVLESTTIIPYLPNCWLQNLHGLLVRTGIQVQIPSLWKITLRRKNDQIIMEYVQKNLPSWMWSGINMCRLFLKALVFSDLTTSEGTEIPGYIYNVATSEETSWLQFPHQAPPPEEARTHWQYFLRHITGGGDTVLTPLGEWIANPYKKYRTVLDITTRLLYKDVGSSHWEIYYHKEMTRNIYIPANITRNRLPVRWVPIRVIEMSCKRLAVIDLNKVQQPPQVTVPILGVFSTKEERTVVGNFQIDLTEMKNLREKWAQEPIHLLCGADGGLKDDIGSSGYCIIIPNRDVPLVTGYMQRSVMRATSHLARVMSCSGS